MNHDAPERLASGASEDEELARALRALRGSDADAARMARVAARLGPLLDAPAPGGAALAGASESMARLLGWKLSAPLLLAATTAAVWWWYGERDPVAQAPVGGAAAASAEVALPSEGPEAAPDEVASTQAVVARANVEEVDPENAALAALPVPVDAEPVRSPQRAAAKMMPDRATVAARAPRRKPTSAPVASHAEDDAALAPAARVASTGSASVAAPRALQAEAASTSALSSAPETRASPAVERSRSEFELLLEARRALASDPEASLALLSEHASRFPAGMLAPEREVLAIDALERLGRHAAASARAARFRAEHPDSPHLGRLP